MGPSSRSALQAFAATDKHGAVAAPTGITVAALLVGNDDVARDIGPRWAQGTPFRWPPTVSVRRRAHPRRTQDPDVPALKAGTFAFHCKIHPGQMSGTFVVK